MFSTITIMPSFLSAIVIASMLLCKYFHMPIIPIIIIILAAIFYQMNMNKKDNFKYSFEEKMINCSKFIIITGILGYILIRIVGLFVASFN